jgi:MscS family membrane protein
MALKDMLTQAFFGNTILQYLEFFGIIIAAVIAGRILYYFFKTFMRILTSKTKTDFDDILIDILEEPLVFVLVIAGFYYGYQFLVLPDWLHSLFDQITKNLVIVAFSWFLIALIDKLIENYLAPLSEKTKSDLDDHIVPLLRKLIKSVLVLLTILIVLSNFGYNVGSVLAGLGIGGLAFALAAQDLLKNFFGGIAILTDKPFKLGDVIEIDKYSGFVVEIGLRSTRLKTAAGDFVTIPNKRIMENSTVNFKKFDSRTIIFTLGLTYGTSTEKMKKAKEILRETILTAKKVNKDSILVSFMNFGPYSLDLDVRFEVMTNSGHEIRDIKDSLNMEIKKRFDKEKISFAYPTQTIEIKK